MSYKTCLSSACGQQRLSVEGERWKCKYTCEIYEIAHKDHMVVVVE